MAKKKIKKRVVITGIGIISPLGNSPERFWQNLKRGKCAIKPVKGLKILNLKKTAAKAVAAQVTHFNVKKFMGADRWEYYGRDTQFALSASSMALTDAGIKYPLDERRSRETGVSLGVYLGSIKILYDYDMDMRIEGPKYVLPILFSNTSPNASASYISIRFNIKGFNSTLSSGNAAALQSIGTAVNMINHHGYKMALAGATQEFTKNELLNLIELHCLAGKRNRKSGKKKQPSADSIISDGFIPGEGACIFLLEELSHARKRKAGIYCEVKGLHENTAIPHNNRPSHHEYLYQAMKGAIDASDMTLGNIGVIYRSHNSTAFMDRTEKTAVNRLFPEQEGKPCLTGIRGNIGDTMPVSGAFSVAAAIGSIRNGFIPPDISAGETSRPAEKSVRNRKNLKTEVTHALINGFSHNGLNASLVIGKL